MPNTGHITTLLAALALLIVIALIVVAATGRLRPLLDALLGPHDAAPRYRKRQLLSPAEVNFLESLDRALPDISRRLTRPVRIYSKVRLADLIEPDISRSNSKLWMSWFARVSQKHADFVLASGPEILCVIELDDKSHSATKQREKDKQQDRALATADLPTIRIRVRRSYSPQEIANTVVHSITQTQSIPAASRRAAGP